LDYQRIYSAFIAHRKSIEHSLTGYTERHHIIPRSLGGGDGRDNLVRLTPEDHFFAHLLLAKIYGGKMSAALFCMMQITERHWGRRLQSRGRYALAKRLSIPALSERWAADKNPLFNHEIFDWVNYRTGDRESATIFDMHAKHGMSRPTWTMVASGVRPSVKGWLLASRIADHKRSEKGQVNKFVNRDGRTFEGTQSEFCNHAGLSDASAWRVVHQRSVTRCGWRLSGVDDRRFNCPRDGTTSGPRAKAITLTRDGSVLTGDRRQIADALGSTPQRVSAAVYAIRAGKASSYMGWNLAG